VLGVVELGYMSINYVVFRLEPNSPYQVKQYDFLDNFLDLPSTRLMFEQDLPTAEWVSYFGREDLANADAERRNKIS